MTSGDEIKEDVFEITKGLDIYRCKFLALAHLLRTVDAKVFADWIRGTEKSRSLDEEINVARSSLAALDKAMDLATVAIYSRAGTPDGGNNPDTPQNPGNN